MSVAAPARRREPRAWPWLAAAALVVAGVIAADEWRAAHQGHTPAIFDPAELRPGFGPRTYEEALARAGEGVESMRERVAHPSQQPTIYAAI